MKLKAESFSDVVLGLILVLVLTAIISALGSLLVSAVLFFAIPIVTAEEFPISFFRLWVGVWLAFYVVSLFGVRTK